MTLPRTQPVALAICAATITSLSYAQQPPNVVTSDVCFNTAMGTDALLQNGVFDPANCLGGPASANTAAGYAALSNNTTGRENSAFGSHALFSNTLGYINSAFGERALFSNIGGKGNSAFGVEALFSNTNGILNTALGISALATNTTGSRNTAVGQDALVENIDGSNNVAVGDGFLLSNTTGGFNVAAGHIALEQNLTGSYNTAVGPSAINQNQTGSYNTAVGYNALGTNQGGSNNIAVGANAGYYIRGSRYNIDIGNVGNQTDVGLIRLGTLGQQTSTYIAGISGTHVVGSAVYVTSTGQLGVLASSERYKKDVEPMGGTTAKLTQLRPVTFKLKTDRSGVRQYGLIAEEVAKVYPELVIRDERGRVEGVRYEELAPMLLNELQVQRQKSEMQAEQIQELQRAVAKLTAEPPASD